MNKLLVIDDGEVDLYIIDKLLKRNNVFPDHIMISDSEAAINLLEQHVDNSELLPDVILLDWIMPCLNGFQFLERFKKIFPAFKKNIEIFVMTCSVYLKDKKAAEKYPFVKAVLIKPLTSDQLVRMYLNHNARLAIKNIPVANAPF